MNKSPAAEPNTRLHGPWRQITRLAWVLVVLVSLGLFLGSALESLRAPLPTGCTVIECDPMSLTADDLALVQGSGLSDVLFTRILPGLDLLWNLSFVVVAGLIFWHRSDDWMALVLSMVLALLGTIAFSTANDDLLRTHPEWTSLAGWLDFIVYPSFLLVLLIFPDGRFVPRWTAVAVVPMLIMFVFLEVDLPYILIFIGYLGVCVYAQIYRYRRVSSPLQRQQTKWVIFGLLGAAGIMVVWLFVVSVLPPERPTLARTYFLLFGHPLIRLLGLLFPVCITIAILRYRLWDIDVIIRRTLVYSLLTLTLGLVYFGCIVVSRTLVAPLVGGSELAIVVSTLAIAALFTPLRRRIQNVIDRRFFRRKYDAAKVLAAFGTTARDETNIGQLTNELLRVVDTTVQPEFAGLWLRELGSSEAKE
jgi:hypothetical protein